MRSSLISNTHQIFRVITSKRITWAGHVALIVRGEAYTGVRWGNMRERDHLEDPGLDGMIILIWIFK